MHLLCFPCIFEYVNAVKLLNIVGFDIWITPPLYMLAPIRDKKLIKFCCPANYFKSTSFEKYILFRVSNLNLR